MEKSALVASIAKSNTLLAEAVSQMVDHICDRWASFPTKEQTNAVNAYLHSVHADGDGTMSEANCENRRIASQRITIAAIPVLSHDELDRLQRVLNRIAFDREYYLPERGCGMHR